MECEQSSPAALVKDEQFRQVMAELQTDHRAIWKLITDLKKVQKYSDAFYEHLVAGNAPPKK